jgi:hypothetical protein
MGCVALSNLAHGAGAKDYSNGKFQFFGPGLGRRPLFSVERLAGS